MIDLTGKVVLLTGASSGIGFETARSLGRSGAHVIAHYSSHRAGAVEATAEIPEDHKLLLQADFTQAESARSLWNEGLAWRNKIDVVVCNAAVMPQSAIGGSDQDWNQAWSEALEINVVQPAHLIREAVNFYVENQGGILIAISSWAAQRGASNANLMAYSASKAALAAMVKTVARAHAKDDVLVYLVAPGVVRTEMSMASARNQGGEEAVTATLAMGEWVPPSEIADLVTYLSSGVCRHLTGATLDVNGATYVR